MLANHRTAVDEHGCGKVDNRGRRPGGDRGGPSPSAASWPRARPDAFLSALTESLNTSPTCCQHSSAVRPVSQCRGPQRACAWLRAGRRGPGRRVGAWQRGPGRTRVRPRLARIYDTIRPQGCPRITGRSARGHAPRWHKSRPSVIDPSLGWSACLVTLRCRRRLGLPVVLRCLIPGSEPGGPVTGAEYRGPGGCMSWPAPPWHRYRPLPDLGSGLAAVILTVCLRHAARTGRAACRAGESVTNRPQTCT